MRLYLIRHAQSIWNEEKRWQGIADIPLHEKGQAQACRLSQRFHDIPLDTIISSDLERATATATFILGKNGADKDTPADNADLQLITDPIFREIDVGTWSGLTRKEIAETHPEQWETYTAGQDLRKGGGESTKMVYDRTKKALHKLREMQEKTGWETAALVSHGGFLRLFVMALLDIPLPPLMDFPIVVPDHASLSEVILGRQGGRLITYNDTAHLNISH